MQRPGFPAADAANGWRLASVPSPTTLDWRPLALIAAGAAVVAAASTGVLDAPSFVVLVALAAFAAIVYLAWVHEPVWAISIGVVLTMFSGFWAEIGLPVGLDRLLLLVGLVSAFVNLPRPSHETTSAIAPRILLGLAILWTASSAILAGTAFDSESVIELVDRIGLVPLLLLIVAPRIFREPRHLRILLGTLVGAGLYLGVIALLETLGGDPLVWPGYIVDESVGIHIDRARGPFAQAVGNGMALFLCGIAAAVGYATWRRRGLRVLALAVMALCTLGLLFTVTRSIWLGAAVATIVVLVAMAELRRFLIPVVVTAGAIVGLALAVVPGLSGQAEERSSNQLPVWDRLNLNVAAVNMVEERPLVGFGWGTFRDESQPYFGLGDYPQRGFGSPAHNTFLSNAAEIGLVGTALWAGALLLAVAAGVLRRRGPPELRPWRFVLLGFAVFWLIITQFVLLVYPFPNYFIWLLAGLALSYRTAHERDQSALIAAERPSPRSTPIDPDDPDDPIDPVDSIDRKPAPVTAGV